MNAQFNEMTEFYGEVIYSYTRKEAIADGVLIDLTANFPDETGLFKYPVACTAAVWSLIDAGATNPRHHQTHAGIIWDILYMSIHGKTRILSEAEHIFCVSIKGAGMHRNFNLKAVCGANDDLTPCITILTEFED